MPYGRTTKTQDEKIERCVEENVAKGMAKETAIRICKASVIGTTKRKDD